MQFAAELVECVDVGPDPENDGRRIVSVTVSYAANGETHLLQLKRSVTDVSLAAVGGLFE